MTRACYGLVMTRRDPTEAEAEQIRATQRRIEQAEAEWSAAIEARDALWMELHAENVTVTGMARATETDENKALHRTTVQRIVTPPKSVRRS